MCLPLYFLMMSTLYLVPMPLGDPDDITLRALRILREVSAIAMLEAEPVGKNLLKTHEISTEIIPFSSVISTLNSGDVALVSKGGTPGIGDAAQEIVRQAIAFGIRVEPLPGASAEITALVLSGLPTDAFVYVGALPDELSAYTHEHETMVFKMHRDILPTLEKFLAAFGDRRICIATHLTRADEILYRGTIKAALTDSPELWAGEAFFVVEGAPEIIAEVWDEARVRRVLRERLADGEPLKLAAKAVAALAGWDRRAVYALGVDEKHGGD